MTNYDAIRSMGPERLACILDQIYVTGLNIGMRASQDDVAGDLEDNPFNAQWLAEPAEEATATGFDEEGDEYLLKALVAAVLKNIDASLE